MKEQQMVCAPQKLIVRVPRPAEVGRANDPLGALCPKDFAWINAVRMTF